LKLVDDQHGSPAAWLRGRPPALDGFAQLQVARSIGASASQQVSHQAVDVPVMDLAFIRRFVDAEPWRRQETLLDKLTNTSRLDERGLSRTRRRVEQHDPFGHDAVGELFCLPLPVGKLFSAGEFA